MAERLTVAALEERMARAWMDRHQFGEELPGGPIEVADTPSAIATQATIFERGTDAQQTDTTTA